jgi:tetratricopeptide (TPR) repeat protein
MKSAEPRCVSRFFAGTVFLFLIIEGLLPAFSGQLDSPVALDRTKSMAATQHEIVMLLIRKGEYERALEEANKIFDMRWPTDQEPLLLRELLYVTGQFLNHRQAPLGLELIDKNSKCFKTPSSQIAILKEQGYLYKTLNKTDKALDCFEKARKMEKKLENKD